jgi:ATP/maltotriose-dependent transcriptional regulator MalT
LVELIYYNTVRSAYGDDPVRLDEAIEGLKRCFSAFTERQHQLYEMRAAHSLALALTQRARQIAISRSALERGDLNEAQQYCQLAERRAVQLKDFKLQCLLLVCRSRIERKRGHFEKAQELATRALKTVGEDFLLIRVRALTARAEASSSLGRYESALQDLLLCDSSTAQVSNPRLRAVALLRCAQIYATTGQSRQASETFEKYLSIKDSVVNAEVRQSESQVRTELARVAEGRDFVVRMIDDNLDPHTIERRLHIFLAEWARSRSASDREAAQQLGVSRQTLLNWSSEKGTRGEFLPGKNRRLRKL